MDQETPSIFVAVSPERKSLIIAGYELPQDKVNLIENGVWSEYELEILDGDYFRYIENIRLSDLKDRIASVSFFYPEFIYDGFEEFYIDRVIIQNTTENIEIYISCQFDPMNWNHTWTLYEQLEYFVKYYDLEPLPGWEIVNRKSIEIKDELNGIDFKKTFSFQDSFYFDINKITSRIADIQKKILDERSKAPTDDANAVVMRFEFPPSVRVYCEQYLQYFSQFLYDVGVNSSSSLIENNGTTIFSVMPRDKDMALEKIHAALDAYLSLPSNITLTDFTTNAHDIETQRLYANIQHLQSQLMLSYSTIQLNNALIIQKDEIILQQNRVLEASILSGDIMRKSKSEERSEEDILKGVASLKKYEFGPLILDAPNILRWLKNYFKKSGESDEA